MVTINNNEKYYDSYEVHVMLEIAANLVHRINDAEWNDFTICQANEYVRDNLYGEIYDYFVAEGYMDNTMTSLSQATFDDTDDLEVIDAFCYEWANRHLAELEAQKKAEQEKRDADRFKQGDYDTLFEIGFMCGADLFDKVVDYDMFNDWAIEFDKEWKAIDEGIRVNMSWVEFISNKLDEKRKQYGLPTEQESRKKESQSQAQIADYVVRLESALFEYKDEMYDGQTIYQLYSQDWSERNILLYNKVMNNIGKLRHCEDLPIAIEQLRDEIVAEVRADFAKYKVGDEVWILYDFIPTKCYVSAVEICSSGEASYSLGEKVGQHDWVSISDSYIYRDPSDIVTRLQSDIDQGLLK